jgi:hypothetical protein
MFSARRPIHPRFAAWLALASVSGAAMAVEPSTTAPTRLAETQLTLQLDGHQGRATAVGAVAGADGRSGTLTIVTAAHFFPGDDEGKPIVVAQPGHLMGTVVSVAKHPSYRPILMRDSDELSPDGTIGVDTAVAEIRVGLRDADDRGAFAMIRPAELADAPIPPRAGLILTVRIVDQLGEEHVVRAGNHLNPKCLAWGRKTYETRRGDSGAGVFVLLKTPDGDPRPVLIGNVSQADERGGLGSLTHRNEPWLAEALDD